MIANGRIGNLALKKAEEQFASRVLRITQKPSELDFEIECIIPTELLAGWLQILPCKHCSPSRRDHLILLVGGKTMTLSLEVAPLARKCFAVFLSIAIAKSRKIEIADPKKVMKVDFSNIMQDS